MTQNLHPFDIISNLLNSLQNTYYYNITITFYPDESGYISSFPFQKSGGRKTVTEFRNLDEAIGQLQQLVTYARIQKSLTEA